MPDPPPRGSNITSTSGRCFDDLQRRGPHPCDEQWFVHRVDVPVALLKGQPLAVFPGIVEVVAVEYQFSSKRPHGSNLDGVGVLREAYQDPHRELGALGGGIARRRGGRRRSAA